MLLCTASFMLLALYINTPLLVSLCNAVIMLFVSLCCLFMLLSVKQLHWWDTVECCLLIFPKPKIKKTSHTLVAWISSPPCLGVVLTIAVSCIVYLHHKLHLHLEMVDVVSFSICVEIISMSSWHRLVLTTAPVFSCNPNVPTHSVVTVYVSSKVLFTYCACSLPTYLTSKFSTTKLNYTGRKSWFHNPDINLR